MIFEETEIAGVWLVRLKAQVDDRGFFARSFCGEEFGAHGLADRFEQSSLSRNIATGTLRGMHFQPNPYGEVKFIRCVRGSIFDVAVDLRPGSPTRGRWIGETLSAENGIGIYVAPGLAHGFQTLETDTDVLYQITPPYKPGRGAGVRWNDPTFGIRWPLASPFVSERDSTYPDWVP